MNKNTFIHLGFSQIGLKGYDYTEIFPHDYVNLIGYALEFEP